LKVVELGVKKTFSFIRGPQIMGKKSIKKDNLVGVADSDKIKSVSIKNKKIDKKKHKLKKKEQTPNIAKLPANKNEYSANWKQLLLQLEKDPKPEKKIHSKPFKGNRDAKKGTQLKESHQGSMESKKPEVWFDVKDETLLELEDRPMTKQANMDATSGSTKSLLVKETAFQGVTRAVAMDCEMVGVGFKGEESILARVSIVNHFGHCVYDKYVKPREKVTDYRTHVSGIRPEDIKDGCDFKVVQQEVSDLLQGRVLVGHSIKNDLKVLFLTHPKRMIRDTSLYKPFRAAFNGKTPSLKNLSARMLGVSVQEGEHSSVQDAQATMRLYTMFKKDWEREITIHRSKRAALSEKQPGGQAATPTKPQTTSYKSSSMGGKPQYVDSD